MDKQLLHDIANMSDEELIQFRNGLKIGITNDVGVPFNTAHDHTKGISVTDFKSGDKVIFHHNKIEIQKHAEEGGAFYWCAEGLIPIESTVNMDNTKELAEAVGKHLINKINVQNYKRGCRS